MAEPAWRKTFNIFLIYGLVVLYALCYQLQQPIEPFLIDKLVKGEGGDNAGAAVTLGRINAFFGFAQGFGSLAVGWVLDRYGVRAGLILNFVACALQYYLLSVTDSVALLYLSKIPAVAVAGFLVAQTAMAKVTEPGEERIAAMGRLTTSYTIGGVAGPYIGGILGSSGDYFLGARCAVGGCLLAIGMVFLLPANIGSTPEKVKNEDEDETSALLKPEKKRRATVGKPLDHESNLLAGDQVAAANMPWSMKAKLVLSLVGVYLGAKLATGVANNMASASRGLILKNDLGFDEAMMGTILSANFAFGGFANAFLLSPLTKMLGGHVNVVVRNCIAIMGAVYLIQAGVFAPGFQFLPMATMGWVYIAMGLFLSIFQFSLATSITADTTAIVPMTHTGTLMGIEHSMFAIAGIVGPLMGTALFASGGISGLALTCAGFFCVVLAGWVKYAPDGVYPNDETTILKKES